MANPRKIRGEYRPIYVTLFNGKDYRALSPDGKLILLTIKGVAGAMGIRVWPAIADALAEMTGMSSARSRRAFTELIVAKWIEYEDGILWLVRGLEFEPQVSHGDKHQRWVRNEVAGLPRVPIVDRFRAYYAHFFADTPSTESGKGIDTLSKPYAIPNHNHNPLPQSLSLTTTTVHNPPDDDGLSADVLLLTTAANAGIQVKYGEQPNPIHYGHAGGLPAVEAIRAAGVDMEFAHAVVFAYASALTLEKPPRSLKYFTQHVIDRWRAEQSRRQVANYRPGAVEAPEVDQMRAFAIAYAREGSAQWQGYCEERGYTWQGAA